MKIFKNANFFVPLFKMVLPWLSVLCVISTASALPVSVVPIRPYVFLAPELPKFTLQPTLKVQAPSSIQQQIQPVATIPK